MSHTEQMREALRHAKRAIENWCDLFPDKKDALDTIAIEAIQAALTAPAAEVPTDGWLQAGALLYRLTDERKPQNRDEINVTMVDGSRTPDACSRRAAELLGLIRGGSQAAAEVPWSVHDGGAYLQHDDMRFDAVLRLDGDFETQDQRLVFAESVRDALNGAKAAATAAEVPEAMGDERINSLAISQWGDMNGFPLAAHRAFARAVIAARDAQWQSTRLRGGVPEIDYDALIRAAFAKNRKWAQGTNGCVAFAKGAEWFREQALTAAPQAPAAALDAGVVRDAERYRFDCATYHNPDGDPFAGVMYFNRSGKTKEQQDALMDAAMSAQAGKGGA